MIGAIISGIFSIGDKMIVDQDKKVEFAFKTQEILFDLLGKLIAAKTIPWVDALVKLMVASVALARPIGSFALTLIGIYLDMNEYPVSETMNTALEAAFPGWMAARQYDKGKKKSNKQLIEEEEW